MGFSQSQAARHEAPLSRRSPWVRQPPRADSRTESLGLSVRSMRPVGGHASPRPPQKGPRGSPSSWDAPSSQVSASGVAQKLPSCPRHRLRPPVRSVPAVSAGFSLLPPGSAGQALPPRPAPSVYFLWKCASARPWDERVYVFKIWLPPLCVSVPRFTVGFTGNSFFFPSTVWMSPTLCVHALEDDFGVASSCRRADTAAPSTPVRVLVHLPWAPPQADPPGGVSFSQKAAQRLPGAQTGLRAQLPRAWRSR